VYKAYPHLKHVDIDYISFATALSNKKWLNTPEGSVYGLDHTPFRYSTEGWELMDINGPVPNLTLAGTDMLCCGISSAIS